MLKKLLSLIPGYFTVSTHDIKRAGNVILHRKIVCSNTKIIDGRLFFDVDLLTFHQKIKNFDEFGIKLKIEKANGLAFFIYRYKKRYGLFLGFALFISLLYLSQSFVWSVRVSPVQNVDSEQIIKNLEKLDFGIGSFIPQKDVLAISNSYLLKYDDLSYIAINIIGNCAEVEVLPAFKEKTPRSPSYPSSIVASRDGFIERLEVFSGSAVKFSGQSVQKGDVIVSGLVYDERDNTYSLVRSNAKVFAKTFRQFDVSIPLTQSETVKTDVVKVKKSLRFFAKEIKFSKNSCVFDNKYDIMIVEEPLVLFGHITLPVFIKTTTATQNTSRDILLDETVARQLANEKLKHILQEENVEVLSIDRQYRIDGDFLTMVCTVYCIENIAIEIPMSGVPIDKKEQING